MRTLLTFLARTLPAVSMANPVCIVKTRMPVSATKPASIASAWSRTCATTAAKSAADTPAVSLATVCRAAVVTA